MKITTKQMLALSQTKNAIYDELKLQLLYHSNKIEGSTFSYDELDMLLENNMIVGSHEINDVKETINSFEVFDFVVKTLGEPLTEKLLREYHYLLKKNTTDDKFGQAGVYKTLPNRIGGSSIVVAEPIEVPGKISGLLEREVTSLIDIANFHQRFEAIHPFQDGNGRVGRFIILKQCIENDIDIVAVDDISAIEYREALKIAQTKHDLLPLVEVFEQCQMRIDNKLSRYEYALSGLEEDIKQEPDIEL